MAEKGFGVKEVNLIGASGTPTITSPNNLNLNANNVAISTNVSIGGTLSVTGNVSVGGTLTYEDVTNIDSVGVVTARSGLSVTGGTSFFAGAISAAGGITGTATTALMVEGDARITGILTIGTASVTIDGDNNEVSVGIVTITNTSVIIGDNVTIDTGASGINSAPNVFYVAKDGSDSNNGTSIDNAKLTIAGAVSVAS